MILHDVVQGTPEWHSLRTMITMSNAGDLITPTGKPTTGAKVENALNTVLAKWLVGGEIEGYSNQWMERGILLEADAREAYEFSQNVAVEQVGFCTNDEGTVGCSPDGFVGDDGLVEIKSPAPHNHVSSLINGMPSLYIPQIQGQMMITQRSWCDYVSFHPQMDMLIFRVERDEAFIQKLIGELASFLNQLEERKKILLEKGYKPLEASA